MRSGEAETAERNWAGIGLVAAVVLMAAAMIVPAVTGWNVYETGVAPLSATWQPRVGWGLLPAIVIALAAVRRGFDLAATLRWPRLLGVAYLVGLVWLVSLATVDGWSGIGNVLGRAHEYLPTARGVTNVSTTLHEFISRIPLSSPHNWPVHVAGHPPGALLFFVALVDLGLGGGLAAGLVVTVLAASIPVAVLLTLRRLGAEDQARRVAPVLVLGPFAVWEAVSADAMFAAVAAWGLCLLAFAATATNPRAVAGWGLGAGALLGYCAFLSYGLPALGILALAVLIIARTARPLPWLCAGYAAVVAAFAIAGFSWWQAYPVLEQRYWAGAARLRPTGYWAWADLALLCFSAGPIVAASATTALARFRTATGPAFDSARTVVLLTLAALVCVVIADASLMSKAEVERIWLPFVPWLLVGAALVPDRWRARAFAGQLVLALALQTLVFTRW